MKQSKRPSSRAMRSEYDFSKGIRGKYFRSFKQGTNLVLLEPDVSRWRSFLLAAELDIVRRAHPLLR